MGKKNKRKPINKLPSPSGNTTLAIKPKWQHILLIIFLTTIIYSNTLHNEFVYDDIFTIVDNNIVRNLKNIPLLFTKSVLTIIGEIYRPLTMVSFTINYKLGGLNVAGYHIVNIIFHTANAVLVYMLIVMLLGIVAGSGNMPNKNNNRYMIALFISLVFATHPMNSETVNYIWQRSVLMATFFYLLAVILFIRYSTERKSLLFLFSIISYILALLSKETAITFPLIVILMDMYFISKFKKDKIFENFKRCHFLFVFITFTFFFIRFFSCGDIREFVSPVKVPMFNYFITQFRVIVSYLRLIIIPKGFSVDHVFPVSESIMDIGVLCAFVVIIVIIFISIRLMKVSKTASLFMLWFFITLIPTSSILPLQIIMNEHRIYLPGIGFFTAFIILIYKFTPDKLHNKIVPFLLSIIIIIFSRLTVNRNIDWKNGFTLWSKTLQTNPNSNKAFLNRGVIYGRQGLYNKAIADYNKAIQLKPKLPTGYNNRGVAYGDKGLHDKAIADYNKAIELEPNYYDAYYNRGLSYNTKGFFDKALADFNKVIELNPEYSETYNDRGILYEEKGQYDKALADYNSAIRLDNENKKAYYNRGLYYADRGLFNKAISDYSKSIELDPKYFEGYNNRGIAHAMNSNYKQALIDFNKAIEINPNFMKAYRNRAIVYRKLGKPDLSK